MKELLFLPCIDCGRRHLSNHKITPVCDGCLFGSVNNSDNSEVSGVSVNRCKGIFGFVFGHSFEARYSLTPAEPFHYNAKNCSERHMEVLMELKRNRAYHHDICVRCGEIKTNGD